MGSLLLLVYICFLQFRLSHTCQCTLFTQALVHKSRKTTGEILGIVNKDASDAQKVVV
jgi:hypothetical protein